MVGRTALARAHVVDAGRGFVVTRSALLAVVLAVSACAIYTDKAPPPKPDRALLRVVIPSKVPDPRLTAQNEVRALQSGPACAGVFVMLLGGMAFGYTPFPFSEAGIPFDLGAAWLGSKCQ